MSDENEVIDLARQMIESCSGYGDPSDVQAEIGQDLARAVIGEYERHRDEREAIRAEAWRDLADAVERLHNVQLCHRTVTPGQWALSDDDGAPKPCIGERCSMWSKDRNDCLEVLAARIAAHVGL